MKYFILILFLIHGYFVSAQSSVIEIQDMLKTINSEIDDFIDLVQAKSMSKGKYQVYILYINDVDYANNKLCFTLGHIMNQDELYLIPSQYYFKRGEELILVMFGDEVTQNFKVTLTSLFTLYSIESESEEVKNIRNRLYETFNERESDAPKGITYTPKGLIFCDKNSERSRQFFNDANDIPIENSIYKYWPKGNIKQID